MRKRASNKGVRILLSAGAGVAAVAFQGVFMSGCGGGDGNVCGYGGRCLDASYDSSADGPEDAHSDVDTDAAVDAPADTSTDAASDASSDAADDAPVDAPNG